jgi:hypothetical protein
VEFNSTHPLCFLSEGYIVAWVNKHEKDARYPEYFSKHTAAHLSYQFRDYFAPMLLEVLGIRQETESAA